MPSPPFALGTFAGPDGDAFAGLVVGDEVHPLKPGVSVRGLLEDWEGWLPVLQRRADERHAWGTAVRRLADLRPLPVVMPSGQIFQAGANYRQHVLELLAGARRRADESDGLGDAGREHAARELDERAAHGAPFVFQGSAHALCGATDEIILPTGAEQPDWELELVAVIGRPTRHVSRQRALEHVAGYTIANDLTLRDRLHRQDVPGGLDWLAAKNPPTFLPLGPLLVPSAHAGNPDELQITLTVNGRVMQDASTSDMLFDVASLIAYVSEITALAPGDLVLTGSPAGNGAQHGVFLAPATNCAARSRASARSATVASPSAPRRRRHWSGRRRDEDRRPQREDRAARQPRGAAADRLHRLLPATPLEDRDHARRGGAPARDCDTSSRSAGLIARLIPDDEARTPGV